MALLELRDLSKRFGGLQALDRVNLTVDDGMIASLIGPNGAGKTTLFNILTGLYAPDEGEIEFQNRSLIGLKPDKITSAGISRTFQNIRLFSHMTVLENVLVGMHSHLHTRLTDIVLRTKNCQLREEEARRRATELIELTGLGGREGEWAHQLSYGEQRRLEIARALAAEPKLLIADEAMAGLSHSEVEDIVALLIRLNERGITVILIEHIMRAVMTFSQRLVVLVSGKKIADGAPDVVIRDKEVERAYLGQ